MLRAITPQTRLVLPCQPEQSHRHARDQRCARRPSLRELPPHVVAVLDEAYYEFLDDAPDTIGYVKRGANGSCSCALSRKSRASPGLRIGYGLASAEIADLLQRARQPFNANSIAQVGAIAGLADSEHQQKPRRSPTRAGRLHREDLYARWACKYVPSSANFVLVHVGDGGEVFKRLMKKGIIVRSMVSYHGCPRIHPRQRRHAGAKRAFPGRAA